MLSAMRAAVFASKLLAAGVDRYDHCGSEPAAGGSEPATAAGAAADGAVADGAAPPKVQPWAAATVKPTSAALDFKEALWLATAGGAAALGLGRVCGRLQVGFAFDALRVSLDGEAGGTAWAAPGAAAPFSNSRVDVFPTDSMVPPLFFSFRLNLRFCAFAFFLHVAIGHLPSRFPSLSSRRTWCPSFCTSATTATSRRCGSTAAASWAAESRRGWVPRPLRRRRHETRSCAPRDPRSIAHFALVWVGYCQ